MDLSIPAHRQYQECWSSVSDVNPCRTVSGVEIIKRVQCRDRVYRWEFQWFLGVYSIKNNTCGGSGCQTEYAWGTCVDCNPGYLEDRRILVEVEREKAVQCRGREYKREFQGLLGAYSFSNSHAVVVVVTQCGVPVWSGIRHTSITEGLWRKLTA